MTVFCLAITINIKSTISKLDKGGNSIINLTAVTYISQCERRKNEKKVSRNCSSRSYRCRTVFGAIASTRIINPIQVEAATKEVEINATNFPDENFREFVSKFIDKNSDGKLSQNECDAVEDIGNPTDTIFKNIKGIEYFTKLETLVLEPCDIKNLDLSKNINLNRLRILDNKSNIQTLDLTKNTKLDTLHLWNSSATNVKVGKNIKSVDLWWSDIGTLDVSECTGLEFFICGPQLKNLIMRKNQVIEAVFNYKGEKDSSAKKWASSNNKVVSIDKTTGKTSFGRCDLLLKCVNTGTSVITSTMDGKTIENFKVTVKGNGWQQENGKWRYYDANGKYYTGWHYMTAKEGEKTPHWSYFGKDGILYTGWKKDG